MDLQTTISNGGIEVAKQNTAFLEDSKEFNIEGKKSNINAITMSEIKENELEESPVDTPSNVNAESTDDTLNNETAETEQIAEQIHKQLSIDDSKQSPIASLKSNDDKPILVAADINKDTELEEEGNNDKNENVSIAGKVPNEEDTITPADNINDNDENKNIEIKSGDGSTTLGDTIPNNEISAVTHSEQEVSDNESLATNDVSISNTGSRTSSIAEVNDNIDNILAVPESSNSKEAIKEEEPEIVEIGETDDSKSNSHDQNTKVDNPEPPKTPKTPQSPSFGGSKLPKSPNIFKSPKSTRSTKRQTSRKTSVASATSKNKQSRKSSIATVNNKTIASTENTPHKTNNETSTTNTHTPEEKTDLVKIAQLVKDTFTTLLQDKQIKRLPNTGKVLEATISRLNIVIDGKAESHTYLDSISVFESLRLCCRIQSQHIKVEALSCFSKLFSFRALDASLLINLPDAVASDDQVPNEEDISTGITPPPKQRLLDAAIDAICACFNNEHTSSEAQLQIIRALSNCLLIEDKDGICHGASLLKVVRTIYNIYIYATKSATQTVAQAALSQILSASFDKVAAIVNKINQKQPFKEEKSIELDAEPIKLIDSINADEENGVTLEQMQKVNINEDDIDNSKQANQPDKKELSNDELMIKDAFLLFRSLAKLSSKSVEHELSLKSQPIRAKLISLHSIYYILKNYIDVFLCHDLIVPQTNDENLFNSVKQYFCLVIARNATSPVSPVFDVTLEILWLLISNCRSELVLEIPVFLTELYFPITELKSSTSHQRIYFLNCLKRICNDPRALIEFYLNYDCNPSKPNVTEMMVNYLVKMALVKGLISDAEKEYFEENPIELVPNYEHGDIPILSSSNLSTYDDSTELLSTIQLQYAMKITSLRTLNSLLMSLKAWSNKTMKPISSLSVPDDISSEARSLANSGTDGLLSPTTISNSDFLHQRDNSIFSLSGENEGNIQFENLKQRKNDMSKCIELFNKKPNKAIPELLKLRFIEEDSPEAIAQWLLNTDGLDLTKVGEYLGEGDDKNISVLSAFIKTFDFKKLSIVDALRNFLQSFRLPGEGQKIDRFMLKFAERYVDHNPGIFSKADTAYVLSYSLIMLNTDLHSKQVKNRMTLDEFIENNAGIDNGKDLPKELLTDLFNEIENNEIQLLSEQYDALLSSDNSIEPLSIFTLFNSRQISRKTYLQVSKEISSKTESMFKGMKKGVDTENNYFTAAHVENSKLIFENIWMSLLATFTSPFKECDEDSRIEDVCLEGLRNAIHLSFLFDIEDASLAFIQALAQFCNLQNPEEIKIKNVKAVVQLLKIALTDGDYLRDSWQNIFVSISQLERLQLIAKGVDKTTVPDITLARVSNPKSSLELTTVNPNSYFSYFQKRATPIEKAQVKHMNQQLHRDIADLIKSSEVLTLMDKIFTMSSELSGTAIVHFIKGLASVALEEIDSSQSTQTPRVYSLQKMIDVCYYNMDRIRVEWTPIWSEMGKAFTLIANNSNLKVVFFALDALRQLSMKFLDIEELNGFEFQSDFLQPFYYIARTNQSKEVQDWVIECFRNFFLIKAHKIKSGWIPILHSLQVCSQNNDKAVVEKTFRLIEFVLQNNFADIVINEGAFAELLKVFSFIAENSRYQKLSLQALNVLQMITKSVSKIYKDMREDDSTENSIEDKSKLGDNKSSIQSDSKDNSPDRTVIDDHETTNDNSTKTPPQSPKSMSTFSPSREPSANSKDKNPKIPSGKLTTKKKGIYLSELSDTTKNILKTKDIQTVLWFPIFSAFYDILMTAHDLEVRSGALKSMFDNLITYGTFFTKEFWGKICEDLLFKMFDIISRDQFSAGLTSVEGESVWLSTTMIQALRSMTRLFKHYFERLNSSLDGFLQLYVACIFQDNDTIAKIGKTCFEDMIVENRQNFSQKDWKKIGDIFIRLFELTTANELFDAAEMTKDELDEKINEEDKLQLPISVEPVDTSKEEKPISEDNDTSETHLQLETDSVHSKPLSVLAEEPEGDKTTTSEADSKDKLNEDTENIKKVEKTEDDKAIEDKDDDKISANNDDKENKGDSTSQDSNTSINGNVIEHQLTHRRNSNMVESRTIPNKSFQSDAELKEVLRKVNIKNTIIMKCVLQLLLIDLVHDIFSTDGLLDFMPFEEEHRILEAVKSSYDFAHSFNNNQAVRKSLVSNHILTKLPNLLKQETSSAETLLKILLKLYQFHTTREHKDRIVDSIMAISRVILETYVKLDEQAMARSVYTWRPVVVSIMVTYNQLEELDFKHHCHFMYGSVLQIMDKDMSTELNHAVKSFLERVSALYM